MHDCPACGLACDCGEEEERCLHCGEDEVDLDMERQESMVPRRGGYAAEEQE